MVFQSARSRVLENTILGTFRQMRANSTMGLVLEGSVSAVGQKSGHELIGDRSVQGMRPSR